MEIKGRAAVVTGGASAVYGSVDCSVVTVLIVPSDTG